MTSRLKGGANPTVFDVGQAMFEVLFSFTGFLERC